MAYKYRDVGINKGKMLRFILFVLFLSLPFNTYAQTIKGTVYSVVDGDTIKIKNHDNQKITIRLHQIDTPEKKQGFGPEATQALTGKIYGKPVEVETFSQDRYGRTIATLWYQGRDINREMVREGYAWVYRKYAKDQTLYDDESYARSMGLGLWSLPENQRRAPWQWRKEQR